MAILEIQAPDGPPLRLLIDRGGVVGRDARADYVIEHPTISRRHAELRIVDGRVAIVDLGSANGTRVNHQPITDARVLNDGDWIQFGRVSARFFSQDSAAPSANDALAASDHELAGGVRWIELLEELSEVAGRSTEVKKSFEAALDGLRARLPAVRALVVLAEQQDAPVACSPRSWNRRKEWQRAAIQLSLRRTRPPGAPPYLFDADEREQLQAFVGSEPMPDWIALTAIGKYGGKELHLYAEGQHALGVDRLPHTLQFASALLRLVGTRFGSRQPTEVTESDLQLAQRIQRRYLSPLPHALPGYRLAGTYLPYHAIGGDFYDFGQNRHGAFVIALGDVSGKGVSAALYMTHLVGGLKLHLPEAASPTELVQRMNDWLLDVLEPGLFATMVVVFLDPGSGRLRIALAGHHPPIVRAVDGRVRETGQDPGIPLGVASRLAPEELHEQLAPGDCLIITSDGVEEAEQPSGEAFGPARRDLAVLSAQHADELVATLRGAVLEFTGAPRSSDDLTVLCLQRQA